MPDKRPFFDHSSASRQLEHKSEPQKKRDIEHDFFDWFESELKSMFSDIKSQTIKNLFHEFHSKPEALPLAINAFLDNPQKYQYGDYSIKKELFSSTHSNDKSNYKVDHISEKALDFEFHSKKRQRQLVNWRRYVGTFDVECWCTRYVAGLLDLNEKLLLSKSQSKDNFVHVSRIEMSGNKREIGRFLERHAKIIAPLLEGHGIDFSATLSPISNRKLRTGDSFYITLDCFATDQLFGARPLDEKDLENSLKTAQHTKSTNSHFVMDEGAALISLFKKLHLFSDNNQNEEASEVISFGESEEENNKRLRDQRSEENDGVLTMNQLKSLYQSTESKFEDTILPDSIPNDLLLELRPYQKYGLSWMLFREQEYDLVGLNNPQVTDEGKEDFKKLMTEISGTKNPLWKECKWPTLSSASNDGFCEQTEEPFYVNLYTGACSHYCPMIQNHTYGGILADEMGLGKTITTLALILSCHEDKSYIQPCRRDRYAHKTTLIIVPMALLSQWESEFAKANGNTRRKCYIYYGTETLGDLSLLLCENPTAPTVILTTYGTVQSEAARITKTGNKIGLFSVTFFRIIIDEGHNIRNKSAKTTKAIHSLSSSRKWVLTGTPIVNRLDDLYSLLVFLDLQPWAKYYIWRRFITEPFDQGRDLNDAFALLKSILDPIILRRTKDQKDKDGNLLVSLPSREIIIERLKFNEKEEILYNHLKAKAINVLTENMKAGLVLKNYSSILTHLLRLRQVCCHLDLIRLPVTDISNEDEDLKDSLNMMADQATDESFRILQDLEKEEEKSKLSFEKLLAMKNEIYQSYPDFDDVECTICTGPIEIETCVITECKHCFCLGCLMEHFNFQSRLHTSINASNNLIVSQLPEVPVISKEVFCPVCRQSIHKNRLFRTFKPEFKGYSASKTDSTEAYLTQMEHTHERDYYIRPFNPYGKSSKINALLSHLQQIYEENPGDHVIVFSQFTSFLDLVEKELKSYTCNFRILKFDGRLNVDQRQRALNEFNTKTTDGRITILLISLKAGGVGLNLTIASKAFLLDPHWNNATEFQAIDRIHRVGQSKSVKVVRFIMEGSIEERMLKIQERKNQLGEALSMNDEERRKKKVEEIEILFAE
ncbi:hypothetical protein KL918_005359 [Ogataea parapolymorpha]|nr:hypothetical protein KL918_005359 [Ogataea parapolymorpha]KAG7868510.1 hypothetical protein KL916_005286 [Ogataea parapolymorpha]